MVLRVHIYPIHNVWDLSLVRAAQTCLRLHFSHTLGTNIDEGSNANLKRMFHLGSCAWVYMYKDGFNHADRSSPDMCLQQRLCVKHIKCHNFMNWLDKIHPRHYFGVKNICRFSNFLDITR